SFRVKEVEFWVKKGFSAHVSAGSGSGGSIRRIGIWASSNEEIEPLVNFRKVKEIGSKTIKDDIERRIALDGDDDVLDVLSFGAKDIEG
ncbi:hypothetical protein Tco_1331338, partial [Tanacetum coccineum]